jgi:hypothetical protein
MCSAGEKMIKIIYLKKKNFSKKKKNSYQSILKIVDINWNDSAQIGILEKIELKLLIFI